MPLVKDHHFLAFHQPKRLFLKQNLFEYLIVKLQEGLWAWANCPARLLTLVSGYQARSPVLPEQKATLVKVAGGPWTHLSIRSLLSSPLQEQNWKPHPVCLPGTSAGQRSPVWLSEYAWLIGFTILHLQLPWPGVLTETRRQSPELSGRN